MRSLPVVLSVLVPQVPFFIAWIVAIVLAIVTWNRHAGVSLLTLIAAVLFILASLANVAFTIILPVDTGMPARTVLAIASVGRVITLILQLVGWGLVIGAIFGWRKRPAPQG